MKERKRQKIYRVVMLIIVVALVTFVVTTVLTYNGSIKYIVSSQPPVQTNSTTKKLDALIATVTRLLQEKYIGDVNEEALIDGALIGLVDSVGDTYTEYYTKSDLESFKTETLGNFVGIGITFQANRNTGAIEVVAPIPNSPAEEAGIKAGDIILKADGVEYTGKETTELANKIKGEEGTEITLTIKRGEETLDIKVQRRKIHINYVTSKTLEENIGYIAISTFDEGCLDDFKEAYNKLSNNGLKSLIIDLRNNGGGLVSEALAMVDLICEKGQTTLISIDKDEIESVTKSETDPEIKIPIVVLTNESTASASEILVAALKDNGKATIVGEKTYGKGVIQELITLSNGGALKVTSAEYYTPKKEKINEVGIEPDYKVQFDEANSKEDNQLQKAVEVLKEKMQ